MYYGGFPTFDIYRFVKIWILELHLYNGWSQKQSFAHFYQLFIPSMHNFENLTLNCQVGCMVKVF